MDHADVQYTSAHRDVRFEDAISRIRSSVMRSSYQYLLMPLSAVYVVVDRYSCLRTSDVCPEWHPEQ